MLAELLCLLLGLPALLVFLAVVGHGMWLLGAAVWREFFRSVDRPPAPPSARRLEPCVCCGNAHPAGASRCPFCGIIPSGSTARELRELEATARRVQGFLDASALDRETCEVVYRCIEQRQRTLIQNYVNVPQVIPVEEAVTPPAEPRPEAVTTSSIAPIEAPTAVAVSAPESVRAPPPEPVAASVPAPVPPRRKRPLTELLAAFMEESNILWGELVGGLLIVGCSVALVISLWRTLKQIPFFPFLLLSAFTGLLFAAGLYTLRHWKLETTSRGLLAIALLLVPLDFLVLANLSHGVEGGVLELLTAVGATVGFAFLVRSAARILVGPSLTPGGGPTDWLTTLAVVGPAASQLLVPRLTPAEEPSPVAILLLGLLAAGCPLVALGWTLLGLHREESVSTAQTTSLLGLLGVAGFSLAAVLGFLLYWNDAAPVAAHALALPVAVAGLPLLGAGTLLRQKLDGLAAAWRTGGTALALAGGFVLLFAVGLAWPAPLPLIASAGVGAVAFAAIALGHRIPFAHLPALVFLTLAYLPAYHLVTGGLAVGEQSPGRLLALAVAPGSGVAVVLLAAVLVGTSELLARFRRRVGGAVHAAFAGGLAALGLLAVAWDAPMGPGRAALVHAVCVALAVLANLRWRVPHLSYAATAVLLGSLFYALAWALPEQRFAHRLLIALLAATTFALLGRRLFRVAAAEWANGVFVEPLTTAALLGTLPAAALLAISVGPGWFIPASLCALGLAGLWLVLAEVRGGAGLFTAFQAALTVSVALAVTAWLERQPWLARGLVGLLDPRSLNAYGVALASLSLAWAVVRVLGRLRLHLPSLPEWREAPAFDGLMTGALILGQLALACWAILPDLNREMAPAGISPQSVSGGFAPVFGLAGWAITGLLAGGLVIGLLERPRIERLLGLVFLAVTASVLWAGGFREERAAASALRWSLAACFLLGSALLWWRDGLARLAHRLGVPHEAHSEADTVRGVLGVCTLPVVLLLSGVALGMALSGKPSAGPESRSFFAQIG